MGLVVYLFYGRRRSRAADAAEVASQPPEKPMVA